jgi:hypothetical protein
VGWFRRKRKPTGDRMADKALVSADLDHLRQFARTRQGVEAYLEPRTTVTENTVMLIAHDGEWTRRRVESPEAARRWAHSLSVPFYDVALMGYPKRMREFNARKRRATD